MKIEPNSENETKQLQDNVVLIINGISESGRVLARMLAQRGADVAIADFDQTSKLIKHIRQDVETNGRRCLLLMPNLLLTDNNKETFSQQAIQKIMETFGRLDAFITYAAADATEKLIQKQSNGTPQPFLFDHQGLTKAAMKKIIGQ